MRKLQHISFLTILVLSLALSLSLSTQAQVRTIPENAKRASVSHVQETVVSINGRQAQLAPGAQIRNQDNLIIMPPQLPSGSLVKYLLDDNGQVARIWILTAEEAAQRDNPPQKQAE